MRDCYLLQLRLAFICVPGTSPVCLSDREFPAMPDRKDAQREKQSAAPKRAATPDGSCSMFAITTIARSNKDATA